MTPGRGNQHESRKRTLIWFLAMCRRNLAYGNIPTARDWLEAWRCGYSLVPASTRRRWKCGK